MYGKEQRVGVAGTRLLDVASMGNNIIAGSLSQLGNDSGRRVQPPELLWSAQRCAADLAGWSTGVELVVLRARVSSEVSREYDGLWHHPWSCFSLVVRVVLHTHNHTNKQTKQNKTKQNKTKQNKTKPNQTKPNQTKPNKPNKPNIHPHTTTTTTTQTQNTTTERNHNTTTTKKTKSKNKKQKQRRRH